MTDHNLHIDAVAQPDEQTKKGEEIRGSHPVHGSRTGENFTINPQKNTWHCFRCNSGGGPLLWIAVEEGLLDCEDAKPGALTGDAFLEAVKAANERYDAGINLEDVDKEELDRQAAAKEVLNTATDLAAGQLTDDLRRDLQKERRLAEEIMDDTRIGFFNDAVDETLRARFEQEALVDSGMYVETDDGLYPVLIRRLVVPYREYGQTYFMIGRRTTEDQQAKYKKTRQTEYNKHILWQEIKDRTSIVITEGIFDAISVSQAGFSVVSPVTTRFREADVSKVVRKVDDFDTVYIAMDMDEGGQEGAKQTAKQLVEAGVEPQLVELPDGMDMDDWTTENGYDLEELLADAEIYLDRLIEQAEEADRRDRGELVDEILELIRDWSPTKIDYVLTELPGTKQSLRKRLDEINKHESSRKSSTENDEANEADERIFEPDGTSFGGDNTNSQFIDTLLEEEENETFRISGTLNDGSRIHTVYLRRGGKEEPYALIYSGDTFHLEPVNHKLTIVQKQLGEDEQLSEDEIELFDYHYINWNDKELRYQHKPFKVGSDVNASTNNVLRYAFKDKQPDENLLDTVRQNIKRYWDHYAEEWYTVLAAWVIHTYFLQDVPITPYIFLNGKADTGKSVCQKTLNQMAYNSYMIEDQTVASLQRTVHYTQCTVHLDEMDKVGEDEAKKIQKSVNSGYQNGAKRIFVDTNKEKIEEQVKELFTYSAKTFAANGLHQYDTHILTRAFIVNSAKSKRPVDDIRDLSEEERQEFADIRDQLFVFSLRHRDEILDRIEKAKQEDVIAADNRELDKISVIYGIVDYFEGAEQADEIASFLLDQNELEGHDISDSDYAVLEVVVENTYDDGIAMLVKKIASKANEKLGYDEESDFSLSSRGVVRRLKEYSMIRRDEHKKRTANGTKVKIPLKTVIDGLHRHELSDMVNQIAADTSIVEFDDENDTSDNDESKESPPSESGDSAKRRSSASSSSSSASKSGPDEADPVEESQTSVSSGESGRDDDRIDLATHDYPKRVFLNYLEKLDDGDGVRYEVLTDHFHDDDQFDRLVEDLLGDGTCFEPKPGRIRKL